MPPRQVLVPMRGGRVVPARLCMPRPRRSRAAAHVAAGEVHGALGVQRDGPPVAAVRLRAVDALPLKEGVQVLVTA